MSTSQKCYSREDITHKQPNKMEETWLQLDSITLNHCYMRIKASKGSANS